MTEHKNTCKNIQANTYNIIYNNLCTNNTLTQQIKTQCVCDFISIVINQISEDNKSYKYNFNK